jgi:membrane associated rhomboid family serine protease
MGLSDVTMALLAVYARIFPRQNLGIFLAGVIPVRMPASRLLNVVAAWSCAGCLLSRVRAPATNVGHAAHLGGIVFGLAYYEAWIRRREWQPLLANAIKRRR